jgi:hypothetical protein
MKQLTIATAGFAAAILLVSVVTASASSSAAGQKTFTVDQTQTSLNIVGNTIATTDDVFSHGRKIGRDQTVCITVGRSATGPLECWATHILPGGQIDSQAAAALTSRNFQVAITGGTGSFANARGSFEVEGPLSAAKKKVVFHIIG